MELRCCIAEVHVNHGVFQITMTEQHLNGAEIRACFVEMRRKTVAKQMGIHVFLEAGALGGFLTCVPNDFRIDGPILASSCLETAMYLICDGNNASGRAVPPVALD